MNDRTFIIAEAGVNHNGSLQRALEMVDVAASAGADVVKFQTFNPEALATGSAAKADYQQKQTDAGESQLEMLKKLRLRPEDHSTLKAHCEQRGVEFLSTPFDGESVDLLVKELRVGRIKVPSGEITNGPLLLKIAGARLPMILSTGMSTLEEVETAVAVLAFGLLEPSAEPSAAAFASAYHSPAGKAALEDHVTLLHCTTEYPAPFGDVNLRAMDTLRGHFGLPTGLSDHTEGIAVPIAAVAMGATVIEKHFTLDRSLPGPDHAASLEPAELKAMIQGIRVIEAARGAPEKKPAPSELKNIPITRKSLVAARDISAGERFTSENLTVKRPGDGLSPMRYWEMMGREACRDYSKNELIRP